MKIDHYKLTGSVLGVFMLAIFPGPAWSEQKTKVSLEVVPAKYVTVSGDAAKFRAMHWMDDGFSGGFSDLAVEGQLDKKTKVTFDSHAFSQDHDYGGALNVIREKFGFLKVDYDTFRKYYDNSGGTYRLFSTLSNYQLDEDLHLDIANLGIEIGSTLENLPEMSLFFNQQTKDGRKSRLSWAFASEGATRRKIAPVWQDIQETTNSFGLRGKGGLAGFQVNGEQKWEFYRAHTLREERNLSTNSTASEKTIVRQDQEPEADIITTMLRGERWFWKDKGYLAMGYRYNKIDNNFTENLRTFTGDRVPTGTTNKFNATADNKYESNTFAGDFQNQLSKNLNFIAKVKTEVIGRRGGSKYPSDSTSPPDSIPNTTENSDVQNKLWRWGENFGLRYSGIKRTSFYGDIELEQTKNWMVENRDSIAGQSASSAGEVFNRETWVNSSKYVLTLGSRTVLNKYFNLTAQFRYRNEDNDYDDERESPASGSSDKSAFFDFLQLSGTEFTTKWTSKFHKRATGSIRYQYQDYGYVSRTENAVNQQATTQSNTFTYDLALQPVDRLLLDLGYMRQMGKTRTPADRFSGTSRIPAYTNHVNSWFLSANYNLSEKLSLTSSFNKSTQHNFDDFAATGMPYGVNASWYDTTVGLKWAYNKSVSLEPQYSYYSYTANPDSENNNYRAHVVWLGVNYNWF